MKHTKGSWVAYENISEFRTGYVGVETADGERIYEREVYKSTYENEFANAALIAAAPDLLEALKEVVRTLESDAVSICDTIWVSNGSPETLYDHCRAAIAKAEGYDTTRSN